MDRSAAAETEQEALRFPDLHPRIEVARGNPATVLREHAEAGGYDVVVIGSKGAGRHLFGSAARDLASASPIPVLLVSATRPLAEWSNTPSNGLSGTQRD
jgi:nucleotide-binding universal stress UspA family protein